MQIVGVVSAHALTYASSLAARCVQAEPVSTQLADGLAVREADAGALAILQTHLNGLLRVSDAEVAHAMRLLFQTTHNVAEGAGAASLAAALQHRAQRQASGSPSAVGVMLTGGNVDTALFSRVLQGASD